MRCPACKKMVQEEAVILRSEIKERSFKPHDTDRSLGYFIVKMGAVTGRKCLSCDRVMKTRNHDIRSSFLCATPVPVEVNSKGEACVGISVREGQPVLKDCVGYPYGALSIPLSVTIMQYNSEGEHAVRTYAVALLDVIPHNSYRINPKV